MTERNEYELICLIVDDDLGTHVIRIAKENGVTGGTIFYGQGTIPNKFLRIFGVVEVRREIVLMISEKKVTRQALEALTERLQLGKKEHGIAFTVPIANFLGKRDSTYTTQAHSRKEDKGMHQAIFTVVERGQSEQVIDAAISAGSRGGTVISARGSGIHETSKLFAMEIEPEKEVVLILAETDKVDSIVAAISHILEIEEPGNGILFTVDVGETRGLIG